MLVRREGPLFTDLYELTMAQAYFARGLGETAVFEAFYRRLPPGRSYVVAAGVADVLDFLEAFRFERDDLEYLASLGTFSPAFLDQLASMRFHGDVWAVPEGTLVFPNEPIVQICAPLAEAQLVETFVVNQLHFQSVIASKAARVMEAARGRTVVEFGSRRAHGIDAGLKLARASFLAGASGTSNVLAAQRYGIPAFGTMAHSYVQAMGDELRAFEAFALLYPGTTLLVDTYDTLRGVERVIELSRRLGHRFDVRAIRLDSGDLEELSRGARARLDAAGLARVEVFASSNLDEHSIAALLERGAPIDGFGVGTRLAVSEDAPSLDLAYKLVEYAGQGCLKLSSGKVSYPGRKQVFRRAEHGVWAGDTIARFDELFAGEPLLVPMMQNGRRLSRADASLQSARRRCKEQLAALPAPLRALTPPASPYPVSISPRLAHELEVLRERSY